jgi:NAD+ kinase
LPRTIAFRASPTDQAQAALAALVARHGQAPDYAADVIVALGGDGFMLETLHATQSLGLPVYGMNCGTIGFLMNAYAEDGLDGRLQAAVEEVIHPLAMKATRADGSVVQGLAINEVSLLRAGPQAAKLRILVDGRERMAELVCDGALVATPAGSTAYNYSAHGPILPIGSDVLALTAVAAFRPRRWRGALLPNTAVVRIEVLDPVKRPVMAEGDGQSVRDVVAVEIRSEPAIAHRILFDPGHGLEERLISEQFA